MIFCEDKVCFSRVEWKALADFAGDESGPHGFHIDPEAKVLVVASYCALLAVRLPEDALLCQLRVLGIQAKQIAKRGGAEVWVHKDGRIERVRRNESSDVTPLEPFEVSHHVQGERLAKLLELPQHDPTPAGSFDFDILTRISAITASFGGSKCRFYYPKEPLGELHVVGMKDDFEEVWHAVLMPLRDAEAQAAYDRREQAEIRQNGRTRLEHDKNRTLCGMRRKEFNLLASLPAKVGTSNGFVRRFEDLGAITQNQSGEWERTTFGDELVHSYRHNGWAK